MSVELDRQIIEKTIEPKLGQLGNDQFIFVMYDVKKVQSNNKWYLAIVVNMAVSLFQNIFYILIKQTGKSFAKYIYPRLLKSYLSQLPLTNVMQVAIDLIQIGNPTTELNECLEEIITAQLQLLNPHLTVNDARGFLNELGQQILNSPPTKYNL